MQVDKRKQGVAVDCPCCGSQIVPKPGETRQNMTPNQLRQFLGEIQLEQYAERNLAALKSYAAYEIPQKKKDLPLLSVVLTVSGYLGLALAIIIFVSHVMHGIMGPWIIFLCVGCVVSSLISFGLADMVKRFYMLVDNSYHIIYLLEKMTKTPSEQKPDKK